MVIQEKKIILTNKNKNIKRTIKKKIIIPHKPPVNKNANGLGIFKIPEKLVVIGDIHADVESLITILENAGLINKNIEWTGKKAILLVIGDLVDGKARTGNWKGDSDITVVRLLEILMNKAREKGGDVIVLLGNHEFMNIKGNFSYSGSKGIKEMGGNDGRLKYFKNQFTEFAKKCYLAVKIGDWLFCHAGIPYDFSHISIPELNHSMQKYFNNKMTKEEENTFYNIISGENGILTNREFGSNAINVSGLNKTLESYGVKHMVVGHTVQSRINSVLNGKLWRVDTGFSRAFGEHNKKRLSFLLIYNFGENARIF